MEYILKQLLLSRAISRAINNQTQRHQARQLKALINKL